MRLYEILIPEDFMFQLTKEEFENLKSQNATSSWGGRRTFPYAFTEHGVLMLSNVLNSDKAITVNIHIMRVYTKVERNDFDKQRLAFKSRTSRSYLEYSRYNNCTYCLKMYPVWS